MGGGSNSAKAKTAPKNQFSNSTELAEVLADYSVNVNDVNLVLNKFHREIADYTMLKISCGLIDAKDHLPNSIETKINTELSVLFELISDNSKSLLEIRTKIKKTLDKLSIYANNIDSGKHI